MKLSPGNDYLNRPIKDGPHRMFYKVGESIPIDIRGNFVHLRGASVLPGRLLEIIGLDPAAYRNKEIESRVSLGTVQYLQEKGYGFYPVVHLSREEYLKSDGEYCPGCGGTNFDEEEGGDWYRVKHTCSNCKTVWVDVWALVGLEIISLRGLEDEADCIDEIIKENQDA